MTRQPQAMPSPRETKPRCPRCGSAKVVPVLYGLPGPKAEEEAERGAIELAGCVLPKRPDDWCCRACEHRWPDDERFA